MIAILMKGMLDPILVDEEFTAAIGALNVSAAKGFEFTVIEQPSQGAVAFANRNIVVIREVDEDGELIGA